jgi:hypothetical protein
MTSIYIADHDTDPFTYLTPSVELGGSPLVTDVTAEEYLQYAAHDLDDGSSRGSVNAMGNAKRALHLIVESLLNAYGLMARNSKASFPRKLELLDAAGLFSLSILNTLNLERNVMEHQYRIPSKDRVREVIDVGRLLLLATQRIGEYVPYECLSGWMADKTLGILQLDPNYGLLSFFKVDGPTQILKYEGMELPMLERIRNVDGSLVPGVEVEPAPMWTVGLEYKNRDNWRPLLRPLVNFAEGRRTVNPAVVRTGGIEVSMRITLPIHRPEFANFYKMPNTGTPVLDYSTFVFGFDPDRM